MYINLSKHTMTQIYKWHIDTWHCAICVCGWHIVYILCKSHNNTDQITQWYISANESCLSSSTPPPSLPLRKPTPHPLLSPALAFSTRATRCVCQLNTHIWIKSHMNEGTSLVVSRRNESRPVTGCVCIVCVCAHVLRVRSRVCVCVRAFACVCVRVVHVYIHTWTYVNIRNYAKA